jgi:hypothetical protein
MQKSNAANCTIFVPPGIVSGLPLSSVLAWLSVSMSSSLLSSSSLLLPLSPSLSLSLSLRATSYRAAAINR